MRVSSQTCGDTAFWGTGEGLTGEMKFELGLEDVAAVCHVAKGDEAVLRLREHQVPRQGSKEELLTPGAVRLVRTEHSCEGSRVQGTGKQLRTQTPPPSTMTFLSSCLWQFPGNY